MMRNQYLKNAFFVPSDEAALVGRAQRGIALIFVLIALVLMSLAAVGLIRMVDTGNLVVGNLAFKQSTTSAADRGANEAVAWLQQNTGGTTKHNSKAAVGYYATSLTELDITGRSATTTRVLVDWNDDDCAYADTGSFSTCIAASDENSVDGYTTSYLITRVCKTAGDPNASSNSCARPVANGERVPPAKGSQDYTNYIRFGTTAGPYFRVVVRAQGPRNTASFTETYVHF
jgi:Tfp pilus assembly protein PilX